MVKRSGAEDSLKKLALTSSVDSTAAPTPEAGSEEVAVDETVPLLELIQQAHREMCEEPRHRDYDHCKEFRAQLEAEECILDFNGADVDAAQSPRCQEMRMFHKWQMAAPAPKNNGTNLEADWMPFGSHGQLCSRQQRLRDVRRGVGRLW